MLQESYVRAGDPAEFLEWPVGDMLRDAARRVPDRAALVLPATAAGEGERTWTYGALLVDSEHVARVLLEHFAPGDRIATLAGTSAEMVLLQMGAALAGLVLVTLNPASRAHELQYLLTQSEVRGVFLERAYRKADNAAVLHSLAPKLPHLKTIVCLDEWSTFFASGAPRALPSVRPDAPALIVFTSGTTGKPKGVVLSHQGIVNNARFTTGRIALESGSVLLNPMPMFHIGGTVSGTLGCFANLGTQVMLTEFNAEEALRILERYRISMTMAVPTMLHGMLRSERFGATDLSALKVIVTGGTPVAPELVRQVERQFGVEVMMLFGQTEAGGVICLTRRGDGADRVTQSVGTPLPLSEAKITSPDGAAIVPIGQVGEICVRARCVMSEYFRMPSQTAGALDRDGWLHTGDLGLMHPDGYIEIKGRLKDMIIRGGENIYPREIEDVLAAHPSVAQAAVFGVPDEAWGEQVAAAVILRSGACADADTLILYLQERIARHKVPKIWQFVSVFPLNTSGKVQKFVLQERYLAERTTSVST